MKILPLCSLRSFLTRLLTGLQDLGHATRPNQSHGRPRATRTHCGQTG